MEPLAEQVPTKPRRRAILVPVVLLLLIAGVGGWYAYSTNPAIICRNELPAFLAQTEVVVREWDDAAKVAGQTPRMALAVQIANLQDVRRRTQDIPTPACAQEVKGHLITTMDASIDAYVSFLGQQSESQVAAHFSTANKAMADYATTLTRLRLETGLLQ